MEIGIWLEMHTNNLLKWSGFFFGVQCLFQKHSEHGEGVCQHRPCLNSRFQMYRVYQKTPTIATMTNTDGKRVVSVLGSHMGPPIRALPAVLLKLALTLGNVWVAGSTRRIFSVVLGHFPPISGLTLLCSPLGSCTVG